MISTIYHRLPGPAPVRVAAMVIVGLTVFALDDDDGMAVATEPLYRLDGQSRSSVATS